MKMPVEVKFPHPYWSKLYLYGIHMDDEPEKAKKLTKRMVKISYDHMQVDEAWHSLEVLSTATMCVSGHDVVPIIFWGVNESALHAYTKDEIHGCIAHEANHVMKNMEQTAYGDGDQFDEETQSYLIQRIVENITPKIMEWHSERNG